MVLLSAQGMPVAKIAEVSFTSADRVRDVIHNGFDSLYPKYKGGRPKTFTLPELREIKKSAKSKGAVEWTVSVDSRVARAHQHAAGARKKGVDAGDESEDPAAVAHARRSAGPGAG
jgi:transposase